MVFNCSFLKYFLLLLCCLCGFISSGNILIGTWNLENFGEKKSPEAIVIMADALRNLDVVAVQEVLISNGGAAAVARLADALSRKGEKWDYVISDITTSNNVQERERYAFLWKTSRLKLAGKPALAVTFEARMCREPFVAQFLKEGKRFTLVNFHALPGKKQPEKEIRYLQDFPAVFKGGHLIYLGDFNCAASHPVFRFLKKDYNAACSGQKTTLKQECKGEECLASEYDNIFYPTQFFKRKNSGIIPFYLQFGRNMAAARKISDHVPVFIDLE